MRSAIKAGRGKVVNDDVATRPPPDPAPSMPIRPPGSRHAAVLVLRERPGANKPDESLALVEPFEVPLPGGGDATMAPAWFDLIGDLQLRLVRETPTTCSTLHASELDELRLDARRGARAWRWPTCTPARRARGAPVAQPAARRGRDEDVDSACFLDRAFWRRRSPSIPTAWWLPCRAPTCCCSRRWPTPPPSTACAAACRACTRAAATTGCRRRYRSEGEAAALVEAAREVRDVGATFLLMESMGPARPSRPELDRADTSLGVLELFSRRPAGDWGVLQAARPA